MEPYTRVADPSRDYTRYPTFAPLPAWLLAPQKPVLRCPGCGGRDFRLPLSRGGVTCSDCGREMTPEELAPVLLTLGASDPAAAEPTPPQQPSAEPVPERAPHIIGLAAGQSHTVVLYSNNQVRAAGALNYGKCNVADWQDIKAIAAGDSYTLGLQKNGRVCLAGKLPTGVFHPEQWQDIEAIAGGPRHIVGLRTDGSLVFCGDSQAGQASLSKLAL